MDSRESMKINRLLQVWPRGTVALHAFFAQHGVSRKLAEQLRIVAEVERRLSMIEKLEATVSANLQRATRLRQSILHKAFSGELFISQ